MKDMPLISKLLLLFMVSALMGSCAPEEKKEKLLNDYDLHRPEKFFMPESVFEISGITFNKGKNDTVYAVQDEDGKLFRLAWGVKKQYHSRFSKKGDYEDVTIVQNRVVVLKSNGALISFPLSDTAYEETDNMLEWKNILPKGEFESLYGDENSGKLYVLCKNCKQDDSKVSVSGYIFDLGDSLSASGSFQIDVNQIAAKAGKLKAGFKPSGLAQNPVTKEWFIISAINKLLVITDDSWTVKQTAHLQGGMFAQPEGIAFDKAGNLYISNEGSDTSEGNILKFPRLNQ